MRITCDALTTFLRANPEAALGLLAEMGERLAYSQDRIQILVNHVAEDRVCTLLEQFARRFGKPSRATPGHIYLHLTHAKIAQSAGLTRPHVSVIMARLRARGAIDYGRSKPLLVNLEGLATGHRH